MMIILLGEIIFMKEEQFLSSNPRQEESLSGSEVHDKSEEASWADGQTSNDETAVINFPWRRLCCYLS